MLGGDCIVVGGAPVDGWRVSSWDRHVHRVVVVHFSLYSHNRSVRFLYSDACSIPTPRAMVFFSVRRGAEESVKRIQTPDDADTIWIELWAEFLFYRFGACCLFYLCRLDCFISLRTSYLVLSRVQFFGWIFLYCIGVCC